VLGDVCAGGLSPLFERLRGRPRHAASYLVARKALGVAGLNASPPLGIGRPSSPFLALLVRAAIRAGRLDVADRLEHRYRRSLAPHRRPELADLAAFAATRP
jgi:hypothetical protein